MKESDMTADLTADRKPIVDGMRVFTNNLDRGVVDLSSAYKEWNPVQDRWVLWFHVLVDTNYKGEPAVSRDLQSDDRVATRFEGQDA